MTFVGVLPKLAVHRAAQAVRSLQPLPPEPVGGSDQGRRRFHTGPQQLGRRPLNVVDFVEEFGRLERFV